MGCRCCARCQRAKERGVMATKRCKVYHLELYTDKGGLLSLMGFGIAKLPDRKRHCLFIIEDIKCEPVAYFDTEEHAHLFQQVFDLWTGGHPKIGRVKGA